MLLKSKYAIPEPFMSHSRWILTVTPLLKTHLLGQTRQRLVRTGDLIAAGVF